MRRQLVFLVMLGISAAPLYGDTRNDIEADLVKAKEVYASAMSKAREVLASQFTRRIEEVRRDDAMNADKKVALIEKLKMAQAAFEKNGTLSADPGMRAPESQFRAAMAAARDALEDTYTKAASAFTKAGLDAEALATLKERNLTIIGEGHVFVGEWVGETMADGVKLKDRWIISFTRGAWSISRKMTLANGREVATGVGQQIRYFDGALQFRHAFTRKPPNWGDSDTLFKVDAGNRDVIEFVWVAKNSKGAEKLYRTK